MINSFLKDAVSEHFKKFGMEKLGLTLKMEVYTEENKKYYSTIAKTCCGERNGQASFTDEEVISIRNRYVNETGREIYKDYKDRVSYSALERILLGTTYSYLPIYKKKQKIWINN